jgi:hypothetical protein
MIITHFTELEYRTLKKYQGRRSLEKPKRNREGKKRTKKNILGLVR